MGRGRSDVWLLGLRSLYGQTIQGRCRLPISLRRPPAKIASRICDTTIGTVKDLSSGPNSPDMELMISPAVVPSFFEFGKPGEHGITIVRIYLTSVRN